MAKKGHFLIFRLQRLGLVQKIPNSNKVIAKKMQKTSIFGHFGPKRPILDSFRLAYKPYLTANFQKKVMNGFRETASHTDERTDVNP